MTGVNHVFYSVIYIKFLARLLFKEADFFEIGKKLYSIFMSLT